MLLKEYNLQVGPCVSIFTKRVPIWWLKRSNIRFYHDKVPFIKNLQPDDRVRYLLSSIWTPRDRPLSFAFRAKLKELSTKGSINTIESWWNTVQGCCLPIMVGTNLWTDQIPNWCNRITKWAFESCSRNYSLFQSHIKAERKLMRQYFMETGISTLEGYKSSRREVVTYVSVSQEVLRNLSTVREREVMIGLLTQTRATGLADQRMINASLEKFLSVVSHPCAHITLNQKVMDSMVPRISGYIMGYTKLSSGPSAVFSHPRTRGGQTAAIAELSQRYITYSYDLHTLEKTTVERTRIDNARKVLDYCIHRAIHRRTEVLKVRVSTVVEPGKARVITVGTLEYVQILSVIAHIFKESANSQRTRSGMKASRHLWNFLWKDLDPRNSIWETISGEGTIYGLSTDLETATDYGNMSMSGQIWDLLIQAATRVPGVPIKLLHLGKELYQSDRPLFSAGKLIATKKRGWLMGDPMTKILFTLIQEVISRSVGRTYRIACSIVGDDLVVLSRERSGLKEYLRLLETLDLKISWKDTCISDQYIYYCEELARIPQSAGVSLRSLARKNKDYIGYIDVPKLRTLIPTRGESDAFSNTNLGRFSLQGKSSEYTSRVNTGYYPVNERALLLQCMFIAEDTSCIHPHIPIEMGGGGSLVNDPFYVQRSISLCKYQREITYRIRSILSHNGWGFRFVHGDRPDRVTHKYHRFGKIIQDPRVFPEGCIIKPRNKAQSELLASVRSSKIIPPVDAFMRLQRMYYFRGLFSGTGEVPDPDEYLKSLEIPDGITKPSIGYTKLNPLTLDEVSTFLSLWVKRGLAFRDDIPFWINREKLDINHPLVIELFKKPDMPWTTEDLIEESEKLSLRLAENPWEIPDTLTPALSLVLDQDAILINILERKIKKITNIGRLVVVTLDVRLLIRMNRILRKRGKSLDRIILIDPFLNLLGMAPDFNPDIYLEDQGGITYVEDMYFQDGMPVPEVEEHMFSDPVYFKLCKPDLPIYIAASVIHTKRFPSPKYRACGANLLMS